FFKGLLFLGAGSVIHAVHTNDIQEMGGLVRKMKITAPAFLIASASIAGIPPLAGFFSKDEIVATAAHHPVFLVLTLLVAFMTAFYMWRLCFLTFFGKPRNDHRYEHAHESPKNMAYPLAFLAVLAAGAGWVGIPGLHGMFSEFAYHHEPYHTHVDLVLMGTATLVALAGVFLAWLMYYKGAISPEKMGQRFKPLYTFLYNKWYFDELYDAVIIKPVLAFGRFFWKFDAGVVDGAVNGTAWLTILWSDIKNWFDKWIIDGAVNGAGWTVRMLGGALRFFQTGRVQFYALFIVVLVVVLAILKFEAVAIDSDWPILTIVFLAGVAVLGLWTAMSGHKKRPDTADADN
ncbi:hypothetical protein GF377_10215, partial [candidate division GN15 bacterium]|nr:hypothetical protein [candidate division GN15 bacterium]